MKNNLIYQISSSPHFVFERFSKRIFFRKIFTLFAILTCGISSLVGQGLTIHSGGNLVANGDVAIVIEDGNFTNNGGFSSGGASTIYMKGSAASIDSKINGTSGIAFQNLTIDKSSNGVQLENNITCWGDIQMQSGDLDLNGQKIWLINFASIQNETETNRIWGDSGEIYLTNNLNAPINANPGNLGLNITSTDNIGTFTVKRIHGAQTINGNPSTERHYKINYFNSGLSIDYQMQYWDAELNGIDESFLQAWNYQNTWQQRNADAANTTSNFIQINNVSESDTLLALSSGMLRMAPKALLGGNYDASGMMNDNLRASGNIPTSEPFTGLGFSLVNCRCDSTTPTVLNVTGNDAIVDWVLVELRDKTKQDSILQSVAALLQKDGDVVDVDGVSPIYVPNLSVDSFFVAIKHRTHIGIISPQFQEVTPVASNYDFTTNIANTQGGTNGIGSTGDGFFAMFPGDVDMNGQIQTSDQTPLIINLGSSGYLHGDLNLDGQVQNTDLNNNLIPNTGKGVQFNN